MSPARSMSQQGHLGLHQCLVPTTHKQETGRGDGQVHRSGQVAHVLIQVQHLARDQVDELVQASGVKGEGVVDAGRCGSDGLVWGR